MVAEGVAEGARLCARWLQLVQVYRDACNRRPQSQSDCKAAYGEAWRAWRSYADHQEARGLPVRYQ